MDDPEIDPKIGISTEQVVQLRDIDKILAKQSMSFLPHTAAFDNNIAEMTKLGTEGLKIREKAWEAQGLSDPERKGLKKVEHQESKWIKKEEKHLAHMKHGEHASPQQNEAYQAYAAKLEAFKEQHEAVHEVLNNQKIRDQGPRTHPIVMPQQHDAPAQQQPDQAPAQQNPQAQAPQENFVQMFAHFLEQVLHKEQAPQQQQAPQQPAQPAAAPDQPPAQAQPATATGIGGIVNGVSSSIASGISAVGTSVASVIPGFSGAPHADEKKKDEQAPTKDYQAQAEAFVRTSGSVPDGKELNDDQKKQVQELVDGVKDKPAADISKAKDDLKTKTDTLREYADANRETDKIIGKGDRDGKAPEKRQQETDDLIKSKGDKLLSGEVKTEDLAKDAKDVRSDNALLKQVRDGNEKIAGLEGASKDEVTARGDKGVKDAFPKFMDPERKGVKADIAANDKRIGDLNQNALQDQVKDYAQTLVDNNALPPEQRDAFVKQTMSNLMSQEKEKGGIDGLKELVKKDKELAQTEFKQLKDSEKQYTDNTWKAANDHRIAKEAVNSTLKAEASTQAKEEDATAKSAQGNWNNALAALNSQIKDITGTKFAVVGSDFANKTPTAAGAKVAGKDGPALT